MATILLIEDDKNMAQLFIEFLNDADHNITHAEDGQSAHKYLAENPEPDLVLLDLKLPDTHGFDILDKMNDQGIQSTVIIVTSEGGMNTAVQAMQKGASDFIVKPTNKERFVLTVQNALERQTLNKTVTEYKKKADKTSFHGFIGESLSMQSVYRIIESAADSKATVFITGESGTGKEVCAEAIHKHSNRAKKPFCAINCGAIPRDLMESEIFGHVKGAFTGAHANHEGAASRAHGGTLFLDELCEMDLDLQTKLLRFIQTGRFQKVGGKKEEEVDVRFVCATNKDPLQYVREGKFREDLYYRLHVLPIPMPALRERENDTLLIADHFLKKYTDEENKEFQSFDDEVRHILRHYQWPGNVRQLQNVIRNIVVLNTGDQVTFNMLPAPLNQLSDNDLITTSPSSPTNNRITPPAAPTTVHTPIHATPESAVPLTMPASSPLSNEAIENIIFGETKETLATLENIEKKLFLHALRLCNGNAQKAAHYLGVSTATIYRKKSAWEKEKS